MFGRFKNLLYLCTQKSEIFLMTTLNKSIMDTRTIELKASNPRELCELKQKVNAEMQDFVFKWLENHKDEYEYRNLCYSANSDLSHLMEIVKTAEPRVMTQIKEKFVEEVQNLILWHYKLSMKCGEYNNNFQLADNTEDDITPFVEQYESNPADFFDFNLLVWLKKPKKQRKEGWNEILLCSCDTDTEPEATDSSLVIGKDNVMKVMPSPEIVKIGYKPIYPLGIDMTPCMEKAKCLV